MSKIYKESGQTRAKRTVLNVVGKSSDKKKQNSTEKKVDTIRNVAKGSTVRNKKLKASSKEWLKRHLNDRFVAEAKKDGYISRAAYKLIEIDQKYKVLQKKDMNILDLGSAPGSWAEVVIRSSKNLKQLVLVDLLDLKTELKSAKFIKGDFTNELIQSEIKSCFDSEIDLIISDIAPNITGFSDLDSANMINIFESMLEFISKNLKIQGNFVAKIFHNSLSDEIRKSLKDKFKIVKIFKPEASRNSSSEIYMICLDKI